MSRGMLARVVLAAAVATCAVSAVLAVVLLTGAPRPSEPAEPGGPVGPAAALATFGSGERVTVLRVVDAVTFDARLEGGRSVVRVRALGVQPPGDCYAAESTAVARRLLEGRSVQLVTDGPGPVTDPFDRRLASATVDRGDYAVLAAEAGIARVYASGASATRMPPIREAQARAQEAGRGVWGPPCLGAAARSGASSVSSASSGSSSDAATPRDTTSSG